jgi:predicted RNA-binding protein
MGLVGMQTFLCVVSPRFPENYHIGVQARTWGVEKRYKNRIERTSPGDELVFLAGQKIRSIHRIESKVYKDDRPLWPPKDGDIFPFRIKISQPTYAGQISSDEFVENISFMRHRRAWGGTIQGASGVFNDHLTDEDVNFIKSRLRKIPVPEPQTARAAEQPEIKNLFRLIGSDVLESLKRILPSLGLTRFNGADFPAEYDLGYGGNVILCRDVKSGELVVVDFNRGEAPTETLIRVLHYMSWVRQTLAGSKDVRGVILTESVNDTLSQIVKEVPNVDLRFYRIGIELLNQRESA